MLVTLYCLVLSEKPKTEINLIPTTMQELVEMVAAGDGDTVEHQLRSRKNELPQQLW